MMKLHQKNPFFFAFWLIVLGVGMLWLRSGVQKLLAGDFPETLGRTLTFFADGAPGNPSTSGGNPYSWYRAVLHQLAIPNSFLIGTAVQWSEVFAGVVLCITAVNMLFFQVVKKKLLWLSVAALLIGLKMNTLFWFAAGWTSPAADSLNLLLMYLQFVLVVTIIRELIQTQKESE